MMALRGNFRDKGLGVEGLKSALFHSHIFPKNVVIVKVVVVSHISVARHLIDCSCIKAGFRKPQKPKPGFPILKVSQGYTSEIILAFLATTLSSVVRKLARRLQSIETRSSRWIYVGTSYMCI